MSYVTEPNFPREASAVLIGDQAAAFLRDSLVSLGIACIEVPNNPDVDERLSGHADLSVLHLCGNRLLLAGYLKGSAFSEELRDQGFQLSFLSVPQEAVYPRDAGLNLGLMGEYLICNQKTASQQALEQARSERRLVQTRQGYSRCASCFVDRRSLITEDAGIASSAERAGLTVLRIQPGAVVLPGFSHGFLGGASFLLSPRRLAFTGRLERHPDRDRILSFLRERAVEPVYLTDRPILDIGSAVPIIEK